MGLLAKIGVTISLFFASLFGGLGFFTNSQIPIQSVLPTNATTTPVAARLASPITSAPQAPTPTTRPVEGSMTAGDRATHLGSRFATTTWNNSLQFAWLPLSNVAVQQFGFMLQNGKVQAVEPDFSGLGTTTSAIADADPKTFMLGVYIYSEYDSAFSYASYAKDKNHVYYLAVNDNLIGELPNADPSTFTIVFDGQNEGPQFGAGESYAKDKNAVYVNYKPMSGVDLGTFKILTNSYGAFTGFSKDKNRLYFIPEDYFYGEFDTDPSFTVLTQADPSTFHFSKDVITPTGIDGIPFNYAKDKNYVYFGTSTIPQADPQTFVAYCDDMGWVGDPYVTCFYAKDKNRVYGFDINGNLVLIPNVDLSTFKVLNLAAAAQFGYSVYAEDKNKVYYGSQIIIGADPATFESIAGNESLYSRDKSHIYYISNDDANTFNSVGVIGVVSGADPATFQYIGGSSYDAQDKNHEYLKGHIVQ